MKAQRIEGATALVTGANRGIGRALTEALLARSVRKIYAAARNPATLGPAYDARLVPLELDVTDAEQVRAAAFPDSFARDFDRQFESSPKASERQAAALLAAMASGSAA